MTARSILNKPYFLQCDIKIKKEQLADMRDSIDCLSAATTRDGSPHSTNQSPVEAKVVMMMQLESDLEADIAQLAMAEQETMKIINQVDDVKARAVLSKRYLGFKSWNDIASEMDISRKWAFNLHTKGLHQVERIISGQQQGPWNKEAGGS